MNIWFLLLSSIDWFLFIKIRVHSRNISVLCTFRSFDWTGLLLLFRSVGVIINFSTPSCIIIIVSTIPIASIVIPTVSSFSFYELYHNHSISTTLIISPRTVASYNGPCPHCFRRLPAHFSLNRDTQAALHSYYSYFRIIFYFMMSWICSLISINEINNNTNYN